MKNRQILAALLIALQTTAVLAVREPKGVVRGRTNKASGEMRGGRGGEHILAPFATPINNADVEGFQKALAGYKGGKLGLYALVGKLAIAVDENHASNLEQGEMAAKTRHLHQMRDMVLEKLKTHPASEGRPRSMQKREKTGVKQGGRGRKAAAGKTARAKAATAATTATTE
jgi:hypothetical protein